MNDMGVRTCSTCFNYVFRLRWFFEGVEERERERKREERREDETQGERERGRERERWGENVI